MQENITFKQNNVWRDNTYTGEWHFMAKEAGQSGQLGRLAVRAVPPGTREHLRMTE